MKEEKYVKKDRHIHKEREREREISMNEAHVRSHEWLTYVGMFNFHSARALISSNFFSQNTHTHTHTHTHTLVVYR